MRLLAPDLSGDASREIEAAIRAPFDKPAQLQGLVTADLTNTLAAMYPKGLVYDDTTDGLKFSNGTAFITVPLLSAANTWSGVQTFSVIPVLSGGGITFPATQVASADANTLDDYEEGTWTPALQFGGAATGMTYSVQQARYTKIGRVVHVQLRIALSAKGSSTGGAKITGLPFASAQEVGGAVYATNLTTVAVPMFRVNAGSDINLLDYTSSSLSDLNDADFTDTSIVFLFCSYTV